MMRKFVGTMLVVIAFMLIQITILALIDAIELRTSIVILLVIVSPLLLASGLYLTLR
jgi:hypothetical protein